MIVAAAIRTADGKTWALPRPARHHDVIALIAHETGKSVRGEEQGFLACSMCYDSLLPNGEHPPHGFFVRRTSAEHLARACGQLTKKLIGSVLTSEDLW